MLTVLYLVGRDAPTSVPLEVANFIHDERVRLVVAAFYGEDGTQSMVTSEHPVVYLKAQGSLDLHAVRSLYKCIVQYQPDVIHVHHTVSAFWGALLGKVFAKANVVRSEHSSHRSHSLGQNVLNWISQLYADRVLCNSENTYCNLHPWERWTVGNRWEKVYNGVDIDRIDRASQQKSPLHLGEKENKVLIGSVGRLIPQKNYERLLQAFSMVVAEKPEAHLVLAGDGKKRTCLEDTAKKEGIVNHITFLGEVSRDQVYALLHELDIFIISSLSEGFCNAVVEAMAAGLPVICSDIRTLREVVGDVATYVDPESPKHIARGILGLVQEDSAQWRDRGAACRKRAIQHYAVERTAEAYVRNYYLAAGRDVPKALETA